MLTLKDVKLVCPSQRGTQLEGIVFYSVSSNPDEIMPKSLFAPLSLDQDENVTNLKKALNNGAIATLWKKEEVVPAFLPTDFPVFFVTNIIESLEMVVKHYIDSYSMKRNETVHTKFLFSIPIKHSGKNELYGHETKDKLAKLQYKVENAIPFAVIDVKGGEELC
jgi:hypothetical protein